MPEFTPHQDAALKAVAGWLKDGPGERGTPQLFRLFGYAGTGKTTLARHLAAHIDGEVKYAAFTGKAALVMRRKGCGGASTIHSLIYRARESGEETPTFELWDDAPASKAKLIVIDECSMVDAELGRDLMSFGVPVLVLGDPAQLPPMQGGGFFTEAEPDAMLTEVHRQAQDDPIVRLSMQVRDGRAAHVGEYGKTSVVTKRRVRPAARARDRPDPGRAQQHAARLQHAAARAARLRRSAAAVGRQAGVPAQQPPQGTVQRRPVERRRAADDAAADPEAAADCRRRFRRQGREGLGAARMLHRQDRGASTGRRARNTTSSTSAMCSPCTRRRARNGTTSCCSTSPSRSPTAASAGSTPASRARRSG